MDTKRLEAFSDGVIAIIITIMVLDLKVPDGVTIEALKPLVPTFISYILSFVYLGIYWSNHHNLLYPYAQVSASVLWANLHLLFWLSLIPFVTGYMGQNYLEALPTACYGLVLLMSSLAWNILIFTLKKQQLPNHSSGEVIDKGGKNQLSIILYVVSVAVSFFYPIIAVIIYVLIECIWLIPNKVAQREN